MVIHGFNQDIDTLERAVKERVFFVKEKGEFVEPPRPQPEHFDHVMYEVRNALGKFLPRAAPLTGQQFVDTFQGRKRKIYQRAWDSLLQRSVSPKDAELKVFVKYEKTDFTRKTDPVPRVISPRDPRYNVMVGRFLRPIEERIFTSIARLFGSRTVFKGMNAADSGRLMYKKWSSFRDPVALGLDASRFDQHVSRDALRWEHDIYLSCFPHAHQRRELGRLLSWQLVNKARGYAPNGKLKYTTKGGRMSGDMNTSLGNCILMCSMLWQYSRNCGVRTELANNGDDCVVFMERRDLARFTTGLDAWFRAMGFSMAVEPPCYTFEALEFCQTHPVWVGPNHDSYIMVRHPKWAIAKDSVSVHPLDTMSLVRGWIHAVGEGGLALTGGIPIFQDFYSAYLSWGKYHPSVTSGQSWGVRVLGRGMHRRWAPVAPYTRASFYWAFGVTPDEQRVLERFYSSRTWFGSFLSVLRFQRPMPL